MKYNMKDVIQMWALSLRMALYLLLYYIIHLLLTWETKVNYKCVLICIMPYLDIHG